MQRNQNSRRTLYAVATTALLVLITLAPQIGSEAAPAFESHSFRWAYDNGAAPVDRSGADDAAITVKKAGTGTKDPVVRLRWSIVDRAGAGISGATIKLQYTTDSTWSSGIVDVGAQGSTTAKWRYRDSAYVSHAATASSPIAGAHGPSAGTVFESTEANYAHLADKRTYEHDFSLEYYGDESATYYFRLVIGGSPVPFSSEHGGQGAVIHTEPQASPTTNYDSHGWRWATDDAARPTDRSGSDDTPITVKTGASGAQAPAARLRWVVTDPSRTGLNNASVRLQYTTQANWSSYAYVGAQGAAGPKWRFRASPYISQFGTTTMPKVVVAHNALAGKTIENESANGLTLPADNKYYEMDLSLEYTGNETSTYYFRLVVNGAPMDFVAMHASQGAIINTQSSAKVVSRSWRWARDDAYLPTDRSAADNASVTVKQGGSGAQDPKVRLRHVLHDHAGIGLSNSSLTYEYTTDDGWSSSIRTVGAPGSSGEKWRYRDSDYLTQLGGASTPALTETNSALGGKAIEQSIASGYTQPAGFGSYENDLSLEYLGNETATYYFRAVVDGVPTPFEASGNSQGPVINTAARTPPDPPTDLDQYGSDHGIAIPVGGTTGDGSVSPLYLDFQMTSPQSGELLTPHVEIRPVGTPFTGTATHSGSSVIYPGAASVAGTVEVDGLTLDTSYHWQAWVSNSIGAGTKVSYGGNSEDSADVTVVKHASLGIVSTYNLDGSAGGGVVDFGTVAPSESANVIHSDADKYAIRLAAESNSQWDLGVQAGGDLSGEGDTIPLNRLEWRSHASSDPWSPFTTTTYYFLSGQAPTPASTLSHDYRLAVSWDDDPGLYTTTVTYVMSAP